MADVARALGKTLTVGADEFTPVFMFVVLRSGATDLHSCVDFILECAPPSMTCGEGALWARGRAPLLTNSDAWHSKHF